MFSRYRSSSSASVVTCLGHRRLRKLIMSSSQLSVPSQGGEEGKSYMDLVSTLPKQERSFAPPIWQYKGYWFLESFLHLNFAARESFKARPSDIFLACFPKSGTTWIKALCFSVLHRNKYPVDQLQQHPVSTMNPHELVLFLGNPQLVDDAAADGDSPRIISMHDPFSLLPESVKGAKIIYLCREPKDNFVSYFQFQKSFLPPEARELANIDEALELYCDGKITYGPVWDHMLEYWREHQKRPQQVLFLRYEGLKRDQTGTLKKLAEFMGCPFSDEEERNGVVEGILNLCSFENLSSLETNRAGKLPINLVNVDKKQFFRRGKTGDWSNHLTIEMAERLDQATNRKLQGSGLTF